MLSRTTPAFYLLALICFLLPFVEVSCNGQKVVSVSGLQLVTGSTLGVDSAVPARQQQHMQPSTPAVVAFGVGIFGLVYAIAGTWRRFVISGAAGVLSAISLLFLQNETPAGAPPEALGMISLSYEPGYYASILLFFAGAGFCLFAEYASRSHPVAGVRAQNASLPSPSPPQPASFSGPSAPVRWQPPLTPLNAPPARACSKCGRALDWNARFCSACGAVLS